MSLKSTVALVIAGGCVLAAVLALAQLPFADAVFEFGVVKQWEGTVALHPQPMLLTPSGRLLLTVPGKHGAASAVEPWDGKPVSIRGSRIARGGVEMIEIASVSAGRAPAIAVAAEDGPEVTLTGEVVDSKCWLGVMNPAEGAVHRDCAYRCIHGGVPPAFAVRGGDSPAKVLLLTGISRDEALAWVARRAEAKGRLVKRNGGWELQSPSFRAAR